MLDLHLRQTYHLDIVLETMPDSAPVIFLDQVLDDLVAYIDSGNAVYMSARKTQAMRARKCLLDQTNQILFLLVGYSDQNVTDPAFENLATGDLRIEPKLSGEGIAISTHMAIDLVPPKAREPIYKAYLEDVPGIGRTKLSPFLTALVRDSGARVLWVDPEGKKRKTRPSFKLVGSLSQSLKDDLKAGKLSTIELAKYNVKSKFDKKGTIKEQKRSILLDVESNPKALVLDVINDVKRMAKLEGYTEMKVTYSPTSKRQTSKKFGTAREDAGDVLTIKVTETKLASERNQCEETLRSDVVTKLRELVLKERP